MRKLNTSDVFAFARIVKASGMREELKKILKDVAASEEMDLEDVGMDTILAILEALSEKQSEAAIYKLLAGPFETTAEEVEKMELPELAEKLVLLMKQQGFSKVDFKTEVNPDLIGGFIVQVEDKRLDASTASQLKYLQKELEAKIRKKT